MANRYWKMIKCPFFHSDDAKSILCEGSTDTSVIRHSFKNQKEKENWQQNYCIDIKNCSKCPIYTVANRKYEVSK